MTNGRFDNTTELPIFVCGEDMADYTGTVCCVTGSELASPGENLSYEYNSNIIHPVYTWRVVSGSISIVSGQNTSIVTLEFGDDFTTGIIRGEGRWRGNMF